MSICKIVSGNLMYDAGNSGALWQPREVGWSVRWDRSLRGRGHMYAYGWFMLMYGRNQHNIVKHLSPNCCCCLVANSCPNLCNPIEHNTPGFPVLYYLRACAQTQVHWVSDAIQHLMSSPSPPWPQSFPASESFPISLLFPSGGQSVGASTSASASVLPMNVQGWLPLGLTGLISCCPRDSKSLPQNQNSKASILQHSAFLMVQLSHLYMTTGKTTALTIWTFCQQGHVSAF